MAYMRRNWVNGEIITDDKMNNIEEGIAEAMKKAEDAETKAGNSQTAEDAAKAIEEHKKDKSNPHGVTKKQLGLENVPNVGTNDQTPTFTEATTLANIESGEKMNILFGKIKRVFTDVISHLQNKSNPHNVTAQQIGLGSVANVSTNYQTPTYAEATTLATLVSGERLAVAFGKIKLAITTLINHLQNKSNPHTVTAAQVGLGNVPNVSTNNQTPTYTEAETLATLESGEKLDVAFGKIKHAITQQIDHLTNNSNAHPASAITGLEGFISGLGYAKVASGSYSGSGIDIDKSDVNQFKSGARKITLPFTPTLLFLSRVDDKLLFIMKPGVTVTGSDLNKQGVNNSGSSLNHVNGLIAGNILYVSEGLDTSGKSFTWTIV